MTTDAHRLSWLQRLLVGLALRPLHVNLRRQFGAQPNDRDKAEEFCERRIKPALLHQREVVLDFKNTGLATQSFIHALISEAVREDPRWAAKIKVANASSAQQAVYDLALRHMLDPNTNKVRPDPDTSKARTS
jgi:uncharacterized protein DUF4325